MNATQVKIGMAVEDDHGNTFTVLGLDKKPDTVSLRSVVAKQVWTNVSLDGLHALPGVRERG